MLRRGYREASVVVTHVLGEHHLTQLEYHLLLDLSCAVDGCGQSEISAHLQAPKTRISILVRGLEQRGLVESVRPEEDRRQVRVRLSPRGEEQLACTQQAIQQAMREFVKGLPPEDLISMLQGALRKYLDLDVTITLAGISAS
ncbi:MAG TPA: MarR family transcriptional regulator [Candidatus Dormibacteraeota bacterium]|nr:MarR family transcriptional regulator [Candidatus Dormibacteraeota bacterium]